MCEPLHAANEFRLVTEIPPAQDVASLPTQHRADAQYSSAEVAGFRPYFATVPLDKESLARLRREEQDAMDYRR